MTRLDQLSRISNAVLTPELNCSLPLLSVKTGSSGSAKEFDCGRVGRKEKAFRVRWCERQKEIIGEFGAVFGV